MMPEVSWRPGENEQLVVCTDRSPVLGELAVSFDSDEITVLFGYRGYHHHHTLDPDDIEKANDQAVSKVAREAVEFLHALLNDEVVFRWGFLTSRTYRRRRLHFASRAWRFVTPWVREAVWSGSQLW